ncbi:MAG: GlsB/YeaQ/YmgE family stress response membrane protein [Bdellovibrionales bacterium]|nr:GlsB/YeaQ/YmgE family stress response membrane protein [Bdellovibrionales bacterium]
MEIIYWTLMIGFITGAATRYIFRKMRLGDLSIAMIYGLIGSVAGGWLGSKLGFYEYGNPWGLLSSTIGSLLIVSIYIFTRKKSVPKI